MLVSLLLVVFFFFFFTFFSFFSLQRKEGHLPFPTTHMSSQKRYFPHQDKTAFPIKNFAHLPHCWEKKNFWKEEVKRKERHTYIHTYIWKKRMHRRGGGRKTA